MEAALAERAAMVRDGGRTVETVDPRVLTGDPIYLFNIYDVEESVNLGTLGSYFMPACPEEREYIRAPQVIPGTVAENYPHFIERENYPIRLWVGVDVANAVIGVGEGPGTDRRKFGWFFSPNATPTKQELATARKHLIPYLQSKVAQADRWATSAKPEERESLDNSHYRAARYLKIKPAWLPQAIAMELCPFCSSSIRPNSSRCASCGEIVNQAAYEATKKAVAGAA